MAKKILLLTRVSTDRQDTEAQEKELISYCINSLGYSEEELLILPPYVGASAIKLNELYLKMLDNIKAKFSEIPTLDAMAVWHLNRLGRNDLVLIQLKQFFIDNKIQFYSFTDNLKLLNDDRTPNFASDLAFNLFATFVKNDMNEKKAKFHRTKMNNLVSMKYNGGYLPYGYTVDDDKNIIINPQEAAIVVEIYDDYANKNMSIVDIYKDLNERGKVGSKFHQATVQKILSNRSYIGEEFKNRNNHAIKYPKLIDKEVWLKCEEIRTGRNKNIVRSKNHFYLSRLIKCPVCGCNMTMGSNRGSNIAYCGQHAKGICSNTDSIGLAALNQLVFRYACILHADNSYKASKVSKEEFIKSLTPLKEKYEEFNRRLDATKAKLNELETKYFLSEMDKQTYEDIKSKIIEKLNYIETEIFSVESTINNKIEAFNYAKKSNDYLSIYMNAKANPNSLSEEEKCKIVHKYIGSITYKKWAKKFDYKTFEIEIKAKDENVIMPTIYYQPRNKFGLLWYIPFSKGNTESYDRNIQPKVRRIDDTTLICCDELIPYPHYKDDADYFMKIKISHMLSM